MGLEFLNILFPGSLVGLTQRLAHALPLRDTYQAVSQPPTLIFIEKKKTSIISILGLLSFRFACYAYNDPECC